MYNDWLTIGPITIHGYGVMIAIGILAAFWLADRQAKKAGLSVDITDNLVFVCLFVGYAFSKLTYVLINFQEFLKHPWTVLGSGGWVVYGGILGGILGAYVYCHIKKVRFLDYFNLLIPEVALAQAFGRIGCFFAGCCYGVETHGSVGVTFPVNSLAPSGVPLVPTQLMSSLGDFIIFLITYRVFTQDGGKNRLDTGAVYLVLYSAGRFFIEFFRGDIERGFIGNLSTSQFIAIFVFAAGIILLVRNHRKKPQSDMVE